MLRAISSKVLCGIKSTFERGTCGARLDHIRPGLLTPTVDGAVQFLGSSVVAPCRSPPSLGEGMFGEGMYLLGGSSLQNLTHHPQQQVHRSSDSTREDKRFSGSGFLAQTHSELVVDAYQLLSMHSFQSSCVASACFFALMLFAAV